ncbi:MAG: pyruvate kinase [Acidobacteria bacterium]|nr:pyruvate kinase [Acidobacteriota bacterium]
MRKTKIVATVGPASDSARALRQLIRGGVDVFRLNMSHGDHASHRRVIRSIRKIAEEHNLPTAILVDLQGPKLRLGTFEGGQAELAARQRFTLTTRKIQGNRDTVSIDAPTFPRFVGGGDRILMDDGLLVLEVLEVSPEDVVTRVISGGTVRSRIGVNLPGASLSAPAVTAKDEVDMEFAVENRIDYLALSFVRVAQDLVQARKRLARLGNRESLPPLIAKIEKPQALDDLQNILEVSDGIMVAHGDLGVEVPAEQVPLLQKKLIGAAVQSGKPVITATQMLESMTSHPRPTRAEASDVANAILDGTDALMLSAETAIGRFPLECVQTMSRIALHTESEAPPYPHFPEERDFPGNHTDTAYAVCRAALSAARQLPTRKIVVFTTSGATANILSSFRPGRTIFAITPSDAVFPRLNLLRGVVPVLIRQIADTDTLIGMTDRILMERNLATRDERIVIVSGVMNVQGATNMMKIHQVGA